MTRGVSRRREEFGRLTEWERELGHLPLLEARWCNKMLCKGGAEPEDLRRIWSHHWTRRMRAGVTEDNQPLRLTEPIKTWWFGIRRHKKYQQKIVDSAAAYLAWHRRLFRKAIYMGEVGSRAKLGKHEADFAEVAARTMSLHCGLPVSAILRRWKEICL